MHAMTAAHRTYPLGSIVRVTNVKTGSAALVRITDRGPFIRDVSSISHWPPPERVDVKKAGVAKVKVELMQAARRSRVARKMGRSDRWISRTNRLPINLPTT